MNAAHPIHQFAGAESDMKERPVIGISVSVDDEADESLLPGVPIYYGSRAIVQAIERAGGLPLMLPLTSRTTMRETVAKLDGLVMTGALRPLPSSMSKMRPLPGLAVQNPTRYRYDAALLEFALLAGLPIMGICRGMQMMNEVMGGSLLRQVDNPDLHRTAPGAKPTTHALELDVASKMHGIVHENVVTVNSYHVQAVDQPGPGMRVCARALDGTVEGIEAADTRFMLGLQFHPELMPDSKVSWQLFLALVHAASGINWLESADEGGSGGM